MTVCGIYAPLFFLPLRESNRGTEREREREDGGEKESKREKREKD